MDRIQKVRTKRLLSVFGVRLLRQRYYKFLSDKENYPDLFQQNRISNQPGSTMPQDMIEITHLTTLDAFCEQNGIQRIDILKTDTEGFDLQVLRGAKKCRTVRLS